MSYNVLESTVGFEGKMLRLRTDHVMTPAGHTQTLEVVEHFGAVAIIPLDSQENVWMVRQYRHPAKQHLLEIPAGTLHPDEDPEACAFRETREEIGMAPGVLLPLGAGFLAPGYSTEYLHFFLARELTTSALEPDEDEQLEIIQIPLKKAWLEVIAGNICDVKTIAGLALTRSHLETKG